MLTSVILFLLGSFILLIFFLSHFRMQRAFQFRDNHCRRAIAKDIRNHSSHIQETINARKKTDSHRRQRLRWPFLFNFYFRRRPPRLEAIYRFSSDCLLSDTDMNCLSLSSKVSSAGGAAG